MDDGRSRLERALRLDPDNPALKARVFFLKGRLGEAQAGVLNKLKEGFGKWDQVDKCYWLSIPRLTALTVYKTLPFDLGHYRFRLSWKNPLGLSMRYNMKIDVEDDANEDDGSMWHLGDQQINGRFISGGTARLRLTISATWQVPDALFLKNLTLLVWPTSILWAPPTPPQEFFND